MPLSKLESFQVQGFRLFRDLRIPHFGDVNLIVGKNNVGKSSLLEALQIYATGGSPRYLWALLGSRDERRLSLITSQRSSQDQALDAWKYLFYGRQALSPSTPPIRVGPLDSPAETVTVSVRWFISEPTEGGLRVFHSLAPEQRYDEDSAVPRLVVSRGDQQLNTYPINRRSLASRSEDTSEISSVYIPATGPQPGMATALWDAISLTDTEKDVVEALRIVTPGITGLSFVGSAPTDPDDVRDARIPIVKVKGITEPIPLRSLGDGMQRMLGLALALANARNSIMLVDEIENGLHYTVQPSLWRLLLESARRLNVQVFATSHSLDCITAFQKAARQDENVEGVLLRLELRQGEPLVTSFDKRRLEIATREQIEVR